MSASHRISLSGAGGEDAASVSPDLSLDGRWLAYVQLDYLGGREVYVQAFPNPGAKWQISSDGARVPIWSPDGRELFYQTDDGAVSVNVDTTSEFTPGTPRPLLRRFDVVAIQEIKRDTVAVRALVDEFLGPDWDLILTDVSAGSAGNTERLGFVFDRRRVKLSGLLAWIPIGPVALTAFDQ